MSLFLQLDYMCVNYDSDDEHIPPPVPTSGPGWTEGQQQRQQQQLHFKFQYVLFFVFFCITYNYLQLDYNNGEWTPLQDDEQGTRDAWCILSPWYVFFISIFYWLIFIICLHNDDVCTPPLTPQWMGLETQMHLVPQVFFFSFDKQEQQGWSMGLRRISSSRYVYFFFLLVVVAVV